MVILCGSLLLITTLCHGSGTRPIRFSAINYAPTSDPEEITAKFKIYPSSPDVPVDVLFGKTSNAGNRESLERVNPQLVSYEQLKFTTIKIALSLNGDEPFGVYYAKANITKENMETNIKMLTRHFNATVLPSNLSSVIRASIGDRVDIGFTGLTPKKTIEWRRNGEVLFRDTSSDTGEASLTLDPVTTNGSGIYEVYDYGTRDLKQHSLVNVIIRGCPSGKWGPPACTGICDICYNGGICEASTGTCVCPTGFNGTYCHEACGGNRFGWNCEYKCTKNKRNPKDTCHYQFCLPDPYGCECSTGLMGPNCDTPCKEGTYGAGCKQKCKCASGNCDPFTGNCDNGCMTPLSGASCQVPAVCPTGYYGRLCSLKCHCKDDVSCDSDGVCSNGQCALGYTVYKNGSCESCQYSSFGADCNETCNCLEVYCHFERGCYGKCFVGWIEPTCNTELPVYSGRPIIDETNDTSVSVRWRPWDTDYGDTGDGPVIAYVIFYRPSHDRDWSGRIDSENGSTQYSVKGLASNTEYELSIAAVRPGIGGEGRPQTIVGFKTRCSCPSAMDSPNTFTELPKQMVIKWSTPPHDNISCPLTHFNIFYSEVGSDTRRSHVISDVNATTLTINNLKTYTQYAVEISSSNKDCEGHTSSTKVFTSEEKAAPPIIAIGDSSPINLHIGTNNLGIFGNIKYFNIRYRKDAAGDTNWTSDKLPPTHDGSAIWIGHHLTKDKRYNVEVSVENGVGSGKWSEITVTPKDKDTGTQWSSSFLIIGIVLLIILVFLNAACFRRVKLASRKSNQRMISQDIQSKSANEHIYETTLNAEDSSNIYEHLIFSHQK